MENKTKPIIVKNQPYVYEETRAMRKAREEREERRYARNLDRMSSADRNRKAWELD